jgi:hypothetical protein
LEYLKQINTGTLSKLQHLEGLVATYAISIEKHRKSGEEQIYADMLEEKTKAMEVMIGKLNDANNEN